MVSKTQIDRLGDRLRGGKITEDDLRMLDEYRRSFSEAYDLVVGSIRNELKLEPTGRPAKSTTSISEKLVRESIRLTQIQDIAGCRLVVTDMLEQDRVAELLGNLFNRTTIVDRREKPSHGYRAVHIIVEVQAKLVEVQVRTSLQHVWAELSEKLSDVVDPKIKYGGGDQSFVKLLASSSELVEEVELLEVDMAGDAVHKERLAQLVATGMINREEQEALIALERDLQDIEERHKAVRERLFLHLRRSVDNFPKQERGK